MAPAPVSPYEPEEPHQFGMYFRGQWYKLTAKAEFINECDPVNRLDAAILQNNLLSPVLGIADPRTDKRIEFIGGIRGLRNWNAGQPRHANSLFPVPHFSCGCDAGGGCRDGDASQIDLV